MYIHIYFFPFLHSKQTNDEEPLLFDPNQRNCETASKQSNLMCANLLDNHNRSQT